MVSKIIARLRKRLAKRRSSVYTRLYKLASVKHWTPGRLLSRRRDATVFRHDRVG
jgi:hypothetical protein